MLLKQLKKIALTEPDSKKLQDNLQVVLDDVTGREIVGGLLLKDQKLVAGTKNRIAHMLGQEPSGYVVVRKRIAANWSNDVGEITLYPFALSRPGWLKCDGQAISRTDYKPLFDKIGTLYGSGNGTTTFNLPDSRQRFWLGRAASGTGANFGDTGGAIDHTHSTPNHTHTVNSHTHTVPAHYHGVGTGADISISTSTGSAGSHQHFTHVNQNVNSALTSSNYAGWGRSDNPGDYNFGMDNAGTGTVANVALSSTDGSHGHSVAANAGNFSGRIGLVTGGVDGNAAMTSGSTAPSTNSSGGSTTGTANPPYIVGEYYIKADPTAGLLSVDVWDAQASDQEKDLYLWLYASVDLTVSLWVF